MKISYKTISVKLTKTELLVVFVKEGKKPKLPAGLSLPAQAVKSFSGKIREARFIDVIEGSAAVSYTHLTLPTIYSV